MFLSIPLFFNFIEMKQQKLLMEKDPKFKKKCILKNNLIEFPFS